MSRGQAPPRDPEAEAYIREQIARQPGAPYYMAQTIVVQEQALNAAQARIEELQQQAGPRRSSGGLLSNIFGDSRQPSRAPEALCHVLGERLSPRQRRRTLQVISGLAAAFSPEPRRLRWASRAAFSSAMRSPACSAATRLRQPSQRRQPTTRLRLTKQGLTTAVISATSISRRKTN